VGERIGDRVHRRRCRADRAELADALDPERIGQAGIEVSNSVRKSGSPSARGIA
jgi:hypothetical protein